MSDKRKESGKQKESQELDAAVDVDEVTVDDAVDPLEQLQQENNELKDRLLRTHAEMENLRKRSERQVADAHKFGIEKFASALLDVADNMERALEVEAGNEEALREGVQLTLNSWHDLMKRFHVERIDAVGQQFDPNWHEALTQMPSDEPEGTVVAQHVAGYSLHGRLIRPAKVLVSSGPQK
ncbi:nucleotide exchange factor GrpE [Mariprofundus ferrooxydans]|uniref:Protein GrpE n=1 Tax=Mariprofundus ferrooxydans PV-1 TaxID=314345 RepID=Q0EZ42_9PROT|nr:nucleotide exchange factor GrpE [Mariprofundus ferrooxydans]EAU54582.1 Molecular chaperone GrpE (heat shock protein) [Mariprofundus ferrooxydans PV-1]KON48809.1 molecular chaperone GrpE [Mariprofundus ferrooxydans]